MKRLFASKVVIFINVKACLKISDHIFVTLIIRTTVHWIPSEKECFEENAKCFHLPVKPVGHCIVGDIEHFAEPDYTTAICPNSDKTHTEIKANKETKGFDPACVGPKVHF